jgi:hypothetical protein
MQEYVIAEGVLKGLSDDAGTFEVVYGFLIFPRSNDSSGEIPQSSVSAIAIRSLKGVPIPLGRYWLISSDREALVLDNTYLGWRIASQPHAPQNATVKRAEPAVPVVIHHARR